MQSAIEFKIELGIPKRSFKYKGHGQSPALTDSELTALFFGGGFLTSRDRLLFAICLYTGCRISEACQLEQADIDIEAGVVTFRAGTTKTKKTRQVAINPQLLPYLDDYTWPDNSRYLFPGKHAWKALGRWAADAVLRGACQRVGLQGVSTHSFRRTFITRLSGEGYSAAQISQATGHQQVSTLMHYFDEV